MGSYNGTCGISQLPILSGDRVVLLFLKHQKYAEIGMGGFCYSTNQYKPLCPVIHGRYDDYGSIEEIEDNIVSQTIFDMFIKNWGIEFTLNEKEIDRGKHFKEPIKPTNIKELTDMIARGCLNEIGFMMMHEELYNLVISEIGNRQCYSKPFIFKQKYINISQDFINKYKESDESLKDLHKYTSDFGRYFRDESSLFLDILVKQNDTILLNSMIDLIMLRTVMEFTRKLFIPQAGAGSQSNELYLYKMIGEYCIKKEKNYKENCAYDECDDVTKKTMFCF